MGGKGAERGLVSWIRNIRIAHFSNGSDFLLDVFICSWKSDAMSKKKKREFTGPTMEEAQTNRAFAVLTTLFDYRCGTLWWVHEEVWMDKVKAYDFNSTREAHPGLSIRSKPLASPFEMVPMLHGGSCKGPLRVKSLSMDTARVTFFGRIAPVAMEPRLFLSQISRNRQKPVLDDGEMSALKNWLKQKGLDHVER